MPTMVARLVITLDDQGNCTLEGNGPMASQKVVAYGLLELAKEIIKGDQRVQPALASDVPRFTKQ